MITQNQRLVLGLVMALGLFIALTSLVIVNLFYPPFGYVTMIIDLYALAYIYSLLESSMKVINYSKQSEEEDNFEELYD
jgi:hypothetical protein